MAQVDTDSYTNEKPATHNADLNHLPSALTPLIQEKRWVVWRWEQRKNGKWTKPPYQAASPNKLANTKDQSTWGSYEQAVSLHARNLIKRSPLDPATDLAGALRRLSDRRRLCVVLRPEVAQCFQKFVLILRRTLPRHARLRAFDHFPRSHSPRCRRWLKIITEIRRHRRPVDDADPAVGSPFDSPGLVGTMVGQAGPWTAAGRRKGRKMARHVPMAVNPWAAWPPVV